MAQYDITKEILCTNIIWDTNGIDLSELNLPKTVLIKTPSLELVENVGKGNGFIADLLSNRFGFCVSELTVELQNAIMSANDLDKLPKPQQYTYTVD